MTDKGEDGEEGSLRFPTPSIDTRESVRQIRIKRKTKAGGLSG